MKKACAVVLSILLMLCLTNVAFASGLETSCVEYGAAEAAQIAYLDLEDASAEMREEILAAREKIIFSTDWVADGYTAHVEDQDGNIIRTLPAFSEVFPDWDLPVSETTYRQILKWFQCSPGYGRHSCKLRLGVRRLPCLLPGGARQYEHGALHGNVC